jgi:hypothetical protein
MDVAAGTAASGPLVFEVELEVEVLAGLLPGDQRRFFPRFFPLLVSFLL